MTKRDGGRQTTKSKGGWIIKRAGLREIVGGKKSNKINRKKSGINRYIMYKGDRKLRGRKFGL